MTTANESRTVVTTPSEVEIAISREFDAPRELVFDAFTRPEHVSRWLLGPDGWVMSVCEIDLRVDGAWRWVWRRDSTGEEFGMSGVYREVTRPSRVVNTEVYEGNESVVTLELTERDGRTTVVQTSRFASQEVRDAVLATGMADGVDASFNRLAGMLPTLA
ncbi:SRPBCC family protein [Saccharothrix coeruleofusca]|uniref:Activator of Hsp90 ATPase homologue 1/2-like C-terminal domain-containing protein n=1 Tax=Saccharothrix coeruleofusca TaxID=33919 RepID=A0A918EIG3_9PSEU|nr:SRPBCC family protein [Saccharothrix coeruleofusca]MBP2338896.1 uncharacterized protein YndB with AHSA1/START domain [Saccharothrix coeruleofusca]GGP86154.1 hypothetical protein GCM10010185_69850 [Saccharothrix coeruleofusca]